MPLEQIYTSDDCIWGLWNVLENEPTLSALLPTEKIPQTITNPLKRLEFMAGRALIKSLLENWDLPYKGLTKDAYGKPYLEGSDIRLSLSHSYPFVAAVVHRWKTVGIDLEQPKDKLLKIAHRVLAPPELADAGTDIVKHCVYWCAKESLIKIYGKKDLILAKDLFISPFLCSREGFLIGRILANNSETAIPLHYMVTDHFVVVVSN
jgi:4'-phosphopantetheinyl transferase